MKEDWFEDRKEVLTKDLVSQYLRASVFFKGIYEAYKSKGDVAFDQMNSWVGTDSRKGLLWNLKDLCHSLFRDRKSGVALRALLFDWILGSIFHECMKLKESTYQLEACRPRYEGAEEDENLPCEIRKIFQEYGLAMKRVEDDLKDALDKVDDLFSQATEQLRRMLPNYSGNGLLITFLLDHQDVVAQVFGKNSLKQTFDAMYVRGMEEAYYVAGKDLLAGAWYQKAIEFFEKALETRTDDAEIRDALNSARVAWKDFAKQ